jgi:hypothetical protein
MTRAISDVWRSGGGPRGRIGDAGGAGAVAALGAGVAVLSGLTDLGISCAP